MSSAGRRTSQPLQRSLYHIHPKQKRSQIATQRNYQCTSEFDPQYKIDDHRLYKENRDFTDGIKQRFCAQKIGSNEPQIGKGCKRTEHTRKYQTSPGNVLHILFINFFYKKDHYDGFNNNRIEQGNEEF